MAESESSNRDANTILDNLELLVSPATPPLFTSAIPANENLEVNSDESGFTEEWEKLTSKNKGLLELDEKTCRLERFSDTFASQVKNDFRANVEDLKKRISHKEIQLADANKRASALQDKAKDFVLTKDQVAEKMESVSDRIIQMSLVLKLKINKARSFFRIGKESLPTAITEKYSGHGETLNNMYEINQEELKKEFSELLSNFQMAMEQSNQHEPESAIWKEIEGYERELYELNGEVSERNEKANQLLVQTLHVNQDDRENSKRQKDLENEIERWKNIAGEKEAALETAQKELSELKEKYQQQPQNHVLPQYGQKFYNELISFQPKVIIPDQNRELKQQHEVQQVPGQDLDNCQEEIPSRDRISSKAQAPAEKATPGPSPLNGMKNKREISCNSCGKEFSKRTIERHQFICKNKSRKRASEDFDNENRTGRNVTMRMDSGPEQLDTAVVVPKVENIKKMLGKQGKK